MIQVLLLVAILTAGSAPADETNFTSSTPACKTVRDFLAINHTDSIDFIRWKLKIIEGKRFELFCSYGVGKANTNGFVNEQKREFTGMVAFNDGLITLKHKDKALSMLQLNPDILHLLNSNGTLMVGNAGWSYTLNSVIPHAVAAVNLKPKNVSFADSIVFEGRTPCKGIEELMDNQTRTECYKKKWRLALYKDGPAASGNYKIGTAEARTGKWKLKAHATGRPVYSLDLHNGNTLDLFQVDENIVYIMDEKGGLMVGDHDFSYSLNRRGQEQL